MSTAETTGSGGPAQAKRKRIRGMGRELVNLTLCSEIFGLSRRTLQHYAKDGKLHFQKVASVAYVLLSEMKAILGTYAYEEFMRSWTYDEEQNTYKRRA